MSSLITHTNKNLYEGSFPIELTEEEQINIFLENVDYLVEQGYDLSDYSYDELYEIFLNEDLLNEFWGALLKGAAGVARQGLGKVVQGAKPELGKLATTVGRQLGKHGWKVGGGLALDQALLGGDLRNTAGNLISTGVNLTKRGASELKKASKSLKDTTAKLNTKQSKNDLYASYQYEPFDLVLEYLLSQGHVDTLDEALYVMMEMDSNTIYDICEAAADQSDKQIDKGVKTTYKAGNVLDNLHQGRSRGLNRLSRTERDAKIKRMRERLKKRRDDLFGERNRREDAAREEIRKKYGL